MKFTICQTLDTNGITIWQAWHRADGSFEKDLIMELFFARFDQCIVPDPNSAPIQPAFYSLDKRHLIEFKALIKRKDKVEESSIFLDKEQVTALAKNLEILAKGMTNK